MKPMLVIIGKSGSGKNFIPELFNLKYTPGYTTRELRPGDNPSLYKMHITDYLVEKIQNKITADTNFDGHQYWTRIIEFNDEQYDFMIVSPKGLNALLNTTQMLLSKKRNDYLCSITLQRPMKFIYFRAPLWKRVLNMHKRGDTWKEIIKRTWHDRTAFKNIESKIAKLGGTIINF